MRSNKTNLIVFLAVMVVFAGCKKQTEIFESEPLSDYLPLKTGKYITYRLDSTIFPNFGRNTEVHSYLEKNIIDSLLPDALGRPSYRVFRYLSDTTGTLPWKPAGSYFITRMDKTAEVIENNLRFVKLALPLKQDFTWKGNEYLPDEPYNSQYSFNNDLDIATWDYTYSELGTSIVLKGQAINDVVTVQGIDDSFNYPVTDPSGYAYINRQQEQYAKGIGLVHQVLIMWEYQPNTGGQGGGFKIGFGVQRSMVDHN